MPGHHQHAVDPDLEEAHRRVRRPLRVHDEVVPVPALQRRQIWALAAGAGGLVDEAEPDVRIVGADVERRRARLHSAVGVVVPVHQRARRRAREWIRQLVPLRIAADPVAGPHRLPAVPALVALVFPERGRPAHQAAPIGIAGVDVAVLHLEARGVLALRHGALDHLDLLRADRLPVAPLVLTGAAVARERAHSRLEVSGPDHVRLLCGCCESRRECRCEHEMDLQADSPWLPAGTANGAVPACPTKEGSRLFPGRTAAPCADSSVYRACGP